ncbi:DUF924 family protein [Rhodobacterales bacterium HKCCE2091]|nr:DUF924 family protein [Rhodobacterales bacterium HKCCE2091]
MADFRPEQVLDLWFPDDGHWTDPERHREFWATRMRGGMDEVIIRDFGPLTEAAARGELDHWAETPRGRLALLIALDQFPRSLWRDTPAAYGQDIKACRLALEAVKNGHFDALTVPWERQFHVIAIGHCEGPDHLERMALCDRLTARHAEVAVPGLEAFIDRAKAQNDRVTGIIRRFGRHPHRSPIYGRVSTPEEAAYIAEGDFPHTSKIETPTKPG